MPLTQESALRKDMRSPHNLELQHRHFAFIADILRSNKPNPSDMAYSADTLSQWKSTVISFAAGCSRTNPSFNIARFLAACDY